MEGGRVNELKGWRERNQFFQRVVSGDGMCI